LLLVIFFLKYNEHIKSNIWKQIQAGDAHLALDPPFTWMSCHDIANALLGICIPYDSYFLRLEMFVISSGN
jgi:hypothetical protein